MHSPPPFTPLPRTAHPSHHPTERGNAFHANRSRPATNIGRKVSVVRVMLWTGLCHSLCFIAVREAWPWEAPHRYTVGSHDTRLMLIVPVLAKVHTPSRLLLWCASEQTSPGAAPCTEWTRIHQAALPVIGFTPGTKRWTSGERRYGAAFKTQTKLMACAVYAKEF